MSTVGSQVTTSGDNTSGPPNNQSHTTPGKDAIEYARYSSDPNDDFGSQTTIYGDGDAQTIRFSSNLRGTTHFTPDSGSPNGAEEKKSVRPVFGFPSQEAPQTDPPKALQQQFSSYNQQYGQQVLPQDAVLNLAGSIKSTDSKQLSDSNLSPLQTPPPGGKSMLYSTISNLIPTEQASRLFKAPSEHESITPMSDSTVPNVNVRDSQLGIAKSSVVRPDYSQNPPSSISSPLELQYPNTPDSSTPTYLSSIYSGQPVTSDQLILRQNKSTEDPFQQNLNMTDTTETVSDYVLVSDVKTSRHYPIIFSGGEQPNSNLSVFGSTTSNSISPTSLGVKNSSRPVGIDSTSSMDKEQLSHELLGIPSELPTSSSAGNSRRIGTVLPKIAKGGRMLVLPPDPISDVTLPPTDAFGAIRDPTQTPHPSPHTASFEPTGKADHIFPNLLTQYSPHHILEKDPIKYSSRQNIFPGAQSRPPLKMNQPDSYFSVTPDSSVQFPSLQFHGESVSPGSLQFDGTIGLWSSSIPILFGGKTSHMKSTGGKQPFDSTLPNGSPNFPGFFMASSFIPFSKTEKPGGEIVPFSSIPSREHRLQNVPITTVSGQLERIIPPSKSNDPNNNMTEEDRLLLFPVSIRFNIPPGLRFSGRMTYPVADSGLKQPLSSYLNSISASGQQRSQPNPRQESTLTAMFSVLEPKQARRTISKTYDGIGKLDDMNYFSPNNPKDSVTSDPYVSTKTGFTGVHNVPGRPIMGWPSMMDGIHPAFDLLSVKNGSGVVGIGYGGRNNGNPNIPYYEHSNTEYPAPLYPTMSESLDIVRQYYPNWSESRQVARKPGTESQPFDAPGIPVITKDSNPRYGYSNNRYTGYDFVRNPYDSTTFESSPLLHRTTHESHKVPEKPVMAAWTPEVGNDIRPNYESQISRNPVPGNVNYPNPSEINSNYKIPYPGNSSYSGTLEGIPLPEQTMPGPRNNLEIPITPTEISTINNYVKINSFSPNNVHSNGALRYGYAPLPALLKDVGRSITANGTTGIQSDVISDNRNINNGFENYDEPKYRFPSLPNVRVENTTSSSTPKNPNVSNQEYENSLSNGIRNLQNPPIPKTINYFSRVKPSIPRSPHNSTTSVAATVMPHVSDERQPYHENEAYRKPNVDNPTGANPRLSYQLNPSISGTVSSASVQETALPSPLNISALQSATSEVPDLSNENNPNYESVLYSKSDGGNLINEISNDGAQNEKISTYASQEDFPVFRRVSSDLTPSPQNTPEWPTTSSGVPDVPIDYNPNYDNQIYWTPNIGNYHEIPERPSIVTTGLTPKVNKSNYSDRTNQNPYTGYVNNENPRYGNRAKPSVSGTGNLLVQESDIANKNNFKYSNLIYRNPNSGNYQNIKYGSPNYPSTHGSVSDNVLRQETALPMPWKIAGRRSPYSKVIDSLDGNPDTPYDENVQGYPFSPGSSSSVHNGNPEFMIPSNWRSEFMIPNNWDRELMIPKGGYPEKPSVYETLNSFQITSSSVKIPQRSATANGILAITNKTNPNHGNLEYFNSHILPNFGALHVFPQGDAAVSGSGEIPKSPSTGSSPDVSLSDFNPTFVNPNYGSESPITVVLTKPSAANWDEALNKDGTNYDNQQYRYDDGSSRKLPIIGGPGTYTPPHSILFESMDLRIRPKTEPQHYSGLGKLDVSTRDSPSHSHVSRSLDADPRSPLELKPPTPASKDSPKRPNIGSPTKLFNYFKTLSYDNPNYGNANNEYPGNNQQVDAPDGSSLQNSPPLKPKDPIQKNEQNPSYLASERRTNPNLEFTNQKGPSWTLVGMYPKAGSTSQPIQLANQPNVTSTDSVPHNPLQPFLGNSEASTTRHLPFNGDSKEIHGRDIVGYKPDSEVDFLKPTDQPGQYVPARPRGTATITVIPDYSKNTLDSESYQYHRVGLDVNASHLASSPMKNQTLRYYPANAQTDQPEPLNVREIIRSFGSDAKYIGAGQHYGAPNPIEYNSGNRQSGLASVQPSALNPHFENRGYTIAIQPGESVTAPDSSRTPIVEDSSTPGSIKYIPGYQEGQTTSDILSPKQDNSDPTNKPYSYRSQIYHIPVNNDVTKSDSKEKDDVSSPDGGDTYPQTSQPGDAPGTSKYYSGNIHNKQTSGEQLPSDPRYGGQRLIMRKLQYHPEIIQLNQSAGDNVMPTNGYTPSGALYLSKQLESPYLNRSFNEMNASKTPEFSSKIQIEIDSPGGAMYSETIPGSVWYHSASKSDPSPIGLSISDQDNVGMAEESSLAGSYLGKSYISLDGPAKSKISTDQLYITNSKESIDVNLPSSATKLTQTRIKGPIMYYQSDKPDQDREGQKASGGIQSYIINTQPGASDISATQQLSGSTVIQNPQMRMISQGYASNVGVDVGQVHQYQVIPKADKYVSGLRLYRQKTETEDASGILSSTVPKMSDISYKVGPNSPDVSASGATAGKAILFNSITLSPNIANYPKIIPPSVGLTNAAQPQVSGSRYIISRPASSMNTQYLSPRVPISSAVRGASMVHHQFINQPITSQTRYSLIPTGYRRIAQTGPAVSNSQSSGDMMKSIIPIIASLPKGMRAGVTRGKYSYTGPDGKMITKDWYVDDTGFHIEEDRNAENRPEQLKS